jgi:hypothetical protein
MFSSSTNNRQVIRKGSDSFENLMLPVLTTVEALQIVREM